MADLMIPDSHGSSTPLCEIYSGSDKHQPSSVIAFNILMGNDKYVGYNYVAKLGNNQ